MRRSLLPFLLLATLCGNAQMPFDLRDAGDRLGERCLECHQALERKPKEVQFGLFANEQGEVYLVITDKRFFDVLFTKPGDGVAVDVVPRSLYDCQKETPAPTGYFKGRVLEPVYLPALKRGMQQTPEGTVMMKVGRLPAGTKDRPFELNLVVLKDRYVCYYNSFFNLESYRWDLLDMGLYLDSLTYRGPVDSIRTPGAGRRDKALQFTIPFARNKAEYSPKDLAPLRDSLRLTDFTIKAIDIHAFSSVEGPEDRNIELQEKRAASIAGSLQSYQQAGIHTTVKASENWVEFLHDVAGTPYRDLADLPKERIKARLQERAVSEALEPILAHHRKALVTLYLEKNDPWAGVPIDQLVNDLEQAIATSNLQRASEIQSNMFARIEDNQAPASLLDRVEIPRRKEFALLLNKRAGFRYFTAPDAAFAVYSELQALDKLMPDEPHIKYNLCAVKFRVWVAGHQAVDPKAFEQEINALHRYKIPAPLVKRMQVNHRIVMAELHMRAGQYAEKDKDLQFVARNYQQLDLTEHDQLSVAQYFASYGNYDEARRVISPALTRIDVSKDLLFYYLNLTITDPEITASAEYRRTMLNAVNSDRQRFCRMFEPFGTGITFQLLDNAYLKKTYCETCDR